MLVVFLVGFVVIKVFVVDNVVVAVVSVAFMKNAAVWLVYFAIVVSAVSVGAVVTD